MSDGAFIKAHKSGTSVWIDMIYVPKKQRGRGEGRKLYERWEVRLPKDIELVRVFASDTECDGNSDGFWEAVGFSYRYEGDEDSLSYEAAHTLVRGVNGHLTPPPIKG